ncbi:hypothetical protein Xhom_00492 [Xenorhabdus hominickii]|uniref:Uncharacterized protein n=1 Tax=Xenorhabdus hominickii TaxID=351679 RepID=A0A2G0QE71_XENHO|nr:hypothetical protein Xhom_00492 [Xenorhabdus hominickii]
MRINFLFIANYDYVRIKLIFLILNYLSLAITMMLEFDIAFLTEPQEYTSVY